MTLLTTSTDITCTRRTRRTEGLRSLVRETRVDPASFIYPMFVVPGRGIQNNLDLLLEVPGAVRKRFGNEKVPHGLKGPDPTNNVESIVIEDAPAGDYLIQISATNILKPAQDYALVVTGRLTSPLRQE